MKNFAPTFSAFSLHHKYWDIYVRLLDNDVEIIFPTICYLMLTIEGNNLNWNSASSTQLPLPFDHSNTADVINYDSMLHCPICRLPLAFSVDS